MKIVSNQVPAPGVENNFTWDLGTKFASELLDAINYLSKDKNRKRLDGEGFKVYWAGTVLRIDIDEKELVG